MVNIVKEVTKAIHEYLEAQGNEPLRITVSESVARELDAEYSARRETFDSLKPPPLRLLAMGGVMFIRGIPVVADLEATHVLDIRR